MAWIPDRGDLVWVSFTPQAGREQAGHRPAVIVSPAAYNRKSGLALMCPVISRVKGYPFEVLIPRGMPIEGAILSDQVRSLDWRARKAELICALPDEAVAEVLGKLGTLVMGQ
jgi:mRNA interferase MazF